MVKGLFEPPEEFDSSNASISKLQITWLLHRPTIKPMGKSGGPPF